MLDFDWKNEKGEAVVEATFVYPVVIFVTAFLLLLGLYEMQGVMEYSKAQYVANYAVKAIKNPGYDSFGTIDDKKLDFAEVTENFKDIDRNSLRAKLYHRFLFDKNAYQSKMETKLGSLLSSGCLLNVDTEVTAVCKKSILNTSVAVSVTDSITMPRFLRYIGLDNEWERTVTATAVVNDPAEFIRNTDLAIETVNKIFEKLGISDNINSLITKTKNFYQKYIKA